MRQQCYVPLLDETYFSFWPVCYDSLLSDCDRKQDMRIYWHTSTASASHGSRQNQLDQLRLILESTYTNSSRAVLKHGTIF